MYACTPTHIHETLFYSVRKFYFDTKKVRNYHSL